MAKKKTLQHMKKEELVQVDVYLLPAPIAQMYRILRETVATEIVDALQGAYTIVKRIQDDAENGEAIVGYDENEVEQWRYYLSPTNVSNAQKAREKDQMLKYLESEGARIEERSDDEKSD